jgi:tRNA pseudouridine38-40 synthase
MQEAADHLIGVHDFAAFSVGHQPRTTRSIRAAVVWSEGGSVFIRIAGNAFLHRMVRRIVGTLVRVGLGDLPAVKVERFLQGGNRAGAGPAAPAHGLTLTHVAYPGDEEAVSAPTRSQAAAR